MRQKNCRRRKGHKACNACPLDRPITRASTARPGTASSDSLAAVRIEACTAQVAGEVTYNGYATNEFVVHRTAAYVDQVDNHIAELTVRSASQSSFPMNQVFSATGAISWTSLTTTPLSLRAVLGSTAVPLHYCCDTLPRKTGGHSSAFLQLSCGLGISPAPSSVKFVTCETNLILNAQVRETMDFAARCQGGGHGALQDQPSASKSCN